jgi:organic radical activating enzyme
MADDANSLGLLGKTKMDFAVETEALTLLTTNKCTAKCAHCCMNSSPKRTGYIDVDAALQTIMGIAGLKTVIFAGGEPTLLKDRLFRMIAECCELGIGTRLVTNASWATNDINAAKMVSRLRAAGLHEINLSADDYHLDYISFENVVRAWKACKSVGFKAVVIASCSHKKSKVTPEYIADEIGEELPRRFNSDGACHMLPQPADDGTIYMLSNAHVQSIGRGRDELPLSHRTMPSSQDDLALPCPFALRSAALSPKNHLLACCGFELEGNAVLDFGKIEDSKEVDVALNQASNNLLVAAISLIGPKFLMDTAKVQNKDLMFKEQYTSICEICEDVVTRHDVIEALYERSDIIAERVIDASIALSVRI